MQEYTLTFKPSSPQHAHEIAQKLKSRAAEMGGFQAMRFSPPLGHEAPTDEELESAAKAKEQARMAEVRKEIAEEQEGESPLTKFGRVFDS